MDDNNDSSVAQNTNTRHTTIPANSAMGNYHQLSGAGNTNFKKTNASTIDNRQQHQHLQYATWGSRPSYSNHQKQLQICPNESQQNPVVHSNASLLQHTPSFAPSNATSGNGVFQTNFQKGDLHEWRKKALLTASMNRITILKRQQPPQPSTNESTVDHSPSSEVMVGTGALGQDCLVPDGLVLPSPALLGSSSRKRQYVYRQSQQHQEQVNHGLPTYHEQSRQLFIPNNSQQQGQNLSHYHHNLLTTMTQSPILPSQRSGSSDQMTSSSVLMYSSSSSLTTATTNFHGLSQQSTTMQNPHANDSITESVPPPQSSIPTINPNTDHPIGNSSNYRIANHFAPPDHVGNPLRGAPNISNTHVNSQYHQSQQLNTTMGGRSLIRLSDTPPALHSSDKRSVCHDDRKSVFSSASSFYESLGRLNPNLVLTSNSHGYPHHHSSGFGSTGTPLQTLHGTPITAQTTPLPSGRYHNHHTAFETTSTHRTNCCTNTMNTSIINGTDQPKRKQIMYEVRSQGGEEDKNDEEQVTLTNAATPLVLNRGGSKSNLKLSTPLLVPFIPPSSASIIPPSSASVISRDDETSTIASGGMSIMTSFLLGSNSNRITAGTSFLGGSTLLNTSGKKDSFTAPPLQPNARRRLILDTGMED
eukprot:g2924.t1